MEMLKCHRCHNEARPDERRQDCEAADKKEQIASALLGDVIISAFIHCDPSPAF
jgi:hypothetical protein